jgi:LDH2 family malate/lactate/ureidoglycolate dehydrogenase
MLFDAIVGSGARLPSQRRFTARQKSDAEGIVLTAAETEQLERLLDKGLDAVA